MKLIMLIHDSICAILSIITLALPKSDKNNNNNNNINNNNTNITILNNILRKIIKCYNIK